MAQIFHRSFNVIAKASVHGFVLLIVLIGFAWAKYVRSDYVTGVDVVRDQPVQFSHEHHVGNLGFDCRYCHTTVETSAFAGMPSTHTCMNCHQQIWADSPMLAPVRQSYASGRPIAWNRVHNLPDFTYFHHGIHVKKGIGCSSCHGRVDSMPLMRQTASLYMEWCLECHRRPELHVRPREEVFNLAWQPSADQWAVGKRLVEEYQIERRTDCSVCHR